MEAAESPVPPVSPRGLNSNRSNLISPSSPNRATFSWGYVFLDTVLDIVALPMQLRLNRGSSDSLVPPASAAAGGGGGDGAGDDGECGGGEEGEESTGEFEDDPVVEDSSGRYKLLI